MLTEVRLKELGDKNMERKVGLIIPEKKLNYYEQECIPVGGVPSAAVTVCLGEGVSARGVSAQGV